jgi:hypothetical protein
MRIAVLVADTHGEPFQSLKNEIFEKTWGNLSSEIDVFTMLGQTGTTRSRILNSISNDLKYSKFWILQRLIDKATLWRYKFQLPKVACVGNEITVEIPEGLRYLGPKYLASLSYLFNQDYDVVYKTTLSSVVQPHILLANIKAIDLEREFYGGSTVGNKNRYFVSGANLTINKTMFELVESQLLFWDFSDYDDVALGKIAKKLNVPITQINTLNIDSLDSLAAFGDSDLVNVMHFRCKSISIPRSDGEIIMKLIERLEKLSES